MKILVTGNKGFIATHLQERLRIEYPDCEIIGFEIDDDPHQYKNEYYDVIFHLAAAARIVECTLDPFGQSHISNIELTKILLSEFSFSKFIYASSCVVYGDRENPNPYTEEDLLRPNSIYAAQKYYSECLVNLELQRIKKPSVALRFFNVYGEGQSKLGNYPNVLAALIKSYINNGYVEVTGDGTQTRNFVYVKDVVDAIIKSANIDKGNHIFNVTTGKEYDINYLANLITDNIKYIPAREFDIYKLTGKYDMINKALGWSPNIDLKEGVERVLIDESIM